MILSSTHQYLLNGTIIAEFDILLHCGDLAHLGDAEALTAALNSSSPQKQSLNSW